MPTDITTNDLFKLVYEDIFEVIKNRGKDYASNFYTTFSEHPDNSQRMKSFLTDTEFMKLITKHHHDVMQTSAKCNKIASQYKQEGNLLYKGKNINRALKEYNRAILHCSHRNGSSLLGICYANRSAVWFHQKEYQLCINDIQLALESNYPTDSQYKLLIRQAKCYQYVSTSRLEAIRQTCLNAIRTSALNDKEKAKLTQEVSCLHEIHADLDKGQNNDCLTSNPAYPALTENVTVKFSNEFGNYICADRDVKAGVRILAERPFCSVTLPDYYLTNCAHCQKRCELHFVPCQSCVDVIYCSKFCQVESLARYHRYECVCILDLKHIGVNMGHLAIRAALTAGYEQLCQLSSSQPESYEQPYKSDTYTNIALLQGHAESRSPQDNFWRCVAAVVMASIVDYKMWSDKSDSLAVLALYTLHNMQVFPCNAHEISELEFNGESPGLSQMLEIGAGIYATLSFFNHSCNPHVVRSFHDGNECHVTALCPISGSDQVFDNYGAVYAVENTESRRQKLRKQYYFDCACLPCVQNWPRYDNLDYSAPIMFKCLECGSLVIDNACTICFKAMDSALAAKQLTQARTVFESDIGKLFKPSTLVQRKQSSIVEQKFAAYSNLVNSLVFQPHKTLNDYEEAMKHLLSCKGNSFEACKLY